MRSKRLLGIVVGVLVVAVVAFLAVGLIFENSLPGQLLRGTTAGGGQEPTYAAATVDGSIGDWDLNADFFSPMFRAHKPDMKVETNLYLRYDCGAGVLYMLVLSAGDWPVLVQDGEAWAAIGSANNKVVFTGFAWVDQGYDGDGGHARGWEASFSLPQAPRAPHILFAHVNVLDEGASQTSGTPKSGLSLGIECYQVTAVFLSRFEAKARKKGVMLIWETTSEVDNLGFNVYTASSGEGPWIKLNADLIPSSVPPGSAVGAEYKFLHEGVGRRQRSFYMLEDIDTSGIATRHGPITP